MIRRSFIRVHEQRGSVSIIVIFIIGLILAMIPALVDMSILIKTHAQAQAAADAAALASTQEFLLGGDMEEIADRYSVLNGAVFHKLYIEEKAVVVEVTKKAGCLFIKRLGLETPVVSAAGKAELNDDVDIFF